MNLRYKAIIAVSLLLSIFNMSALFLRKESESGLPPNILNRQSMLACKSEEFHYVNIYRLISQPDLYNQRTVVVDGFFKFDEIEGVAKIGTKAIDINDWSIGEALDLNFREADGVRKTSNEPIQPIGEEKQKFYKYLNGKQVRVKGIFQYYECSIQKESQFIAIGVIQNAEIMSIVGGGVMRIPNVKE